MDMKDFLSGSYSSISVGDISSHLHAVELAKSY